MAARCSGGVSFTRNPEAPSCRARAMCSSVSKVVRMPMTGAPGRHGDRPAHSRPLRPGIRMSRRTTSGRSRRMVSTAWSPSTAATTSMSSAAPRMSSKPERTRLRRRRLPRGSRLSPYDGAGRGRPRERRRRDAGWPASLSVDGSVVGDGDRHLDVAARRVGVGADLMASSASCWAWSCSIPGRTTSRSTAQLVAALAVGADLGREPPTEVSVSLTLWPRATACSAL